MTSRKVFNLAILFVFAVSLLFGGNGLVLAQNPPPPNSAGGNGNGQGQDKKITHADREAAAERAAEAGLLMEEMGTAEMAMPGEAPHYFSHPNYTNSPLLGNAVADWNAIAQEIIQPMPMPGMEMGSIMMSEGLVYLSYVQAAVYDALVSIEGGYTPYNPSLPPADPNASRDAAVATAAYTVLANFFPESLATLDSKYASALAVIADGVEKDAGIAAGAQAAAGIIALRANDGRGTPDTYTLPAPGPGVWEPNMMMPMIDPWMAVMVPFTLTSPDQFRPAPPPALDSPEWAAQVNAVKEIGGAMSMTRTTEQTEIAQFWASNGVIQFNTAYREIAKDQGLNLLDTARLMAIGNIVGADSLIACFDSKYTYSFWRPVTAIQKADTDGNDLTEPDPGWMPLLMTPNHPEYVAGHSCYASSQAEVLSSVLGTTDIGLTLKSTVGSEPRFYQTADALRQEINNARVWAGLHYPMSVELGAQLGQNVAQHALANFFAPAPTVSEHASISGGIRKFVDGLPGLGPDMANNLGQYIPVAEADTETYPGSDYYEIAVVEYEEKMHSDLPPTKLRGYIQLSTAVVPGNQIPLTYLDGSPIVLPDGIQAYAVDEPHYLGPMIIAEKDRPVRLLFRNLLPTGSDGDLFIPVDTTVMGSGPGPLMDHDMMDDPQNPMCGMEPKPAECYTENRATVHLHGGRSPWISDGTPHQWITPAGENTPYPQGVSVVPVPDMRDVDNGDPIDGMMTYYFTNQQSARLMFYHDHSYGITRLNVYAGEAAPYLITDSMEKALVDAGLIPSEQLPLVVQDKTFVPNEAQLAVSDKTWDMERWGDLGDLWLPHVYSPGQNPGDASGVNQFGRWMYGPWFWPPTNGIEHGPIPNPYYNPACDPDVQWCEPPTMPGTPFNSMGMEAFMDTPIVNGTAYPTITIEPKSYRFRILNAANDRFFNFSLYQAVDANGVLCDASNLAPAAEASGVACTEVLLNPDEVAASLDDPAVNFPTPVVGTEGPDWIQIGTEGGFLPAPVVIPAHPTTWFNDPTVFNAGNVDQHSLLIAPAERADVIVDFSQYAGQTLILYNDAPAAFPARDPRYDYYTGSADLVDTGGVPTIIAGYGPNTRTVMQIVVADTAPAAAFDLGALQTAFLAEGLGGLGVFENSQAKIIVGQGAYNSAYGTAFPNNGPLAGLVQIFETSKTFLTLAGEQLTMVFKPKMIQDEMGEAFEHEYGRMSGNLGVESPNPQAGLQNMILYAYMSPPTEVLKALPPGADMTPIASADDGTQIWKITHNGVDTHPIHFHLYEVQLLNRVGWDGIIRRPDPNELGWKETVRVSPLEDTIVAMRPVVPEVPWDLPNSVRLLDPTMPEGAYIANTTQQEAAGLPIFAFDPNGEPIDIINHTVNFGWEYVWHCHILSHEEMDMMRPQVVGLAPAAPVDLSAIRVGSGRNRRVDLVWTDTSLNDTAFVVERATSAAGPWSVLATIVTDGTSTGQMGYTNSIGNTNQVFFYRVQAVNEVGDTWDYSNPALNEGAGFPTLRLTSAYSDVASWVATVAPAAPSNLIGTAVRQGGNARVTLNWTDNANNESGFQIQWAQNAAFTTGLVNRTVGANVTSYNTGNIARLTTFYFRVRATNEAGVSDWSNTFSITTP